MARIQKIFSSERSNVYNIQGTDAEIQDIKQQIDALCGDTKSRLSPPLQQKYFKEMSVFIDRGDPLFDQLTQMLVMLKLQST